MMADEPTRLVPKLRFPEFDAAPDWEEVTLGKLLDLPPNYGVNAAAVSYSESLPTYLRITDINDDGQFEQCSRVSVDIKASDEHYLQNGDIVLARTGASVGKSYRHREEDGRLVYAGFLIRVRPNRKRLLSQFLAAYLSTGSYWDWVRLISARSGQPGINGTEYASMPLPLPPDGRDLAEQQKIADCLGALDDLISAQGRKLDALRRHKKGLMQQLFPRPGETVPRLRFPEFQEAGDWKTMKWGDFVSRGKEKFDPRNSSDTPRLIELENIESKTGRIPSLTQLEKQSSLKSWFQAGDVLFGKLRPYLQKFARPDFQGVCTTEIWVLRSKEVSSEFLFYLVQTERFIQLANVSSGSRMPRAEWNILAGANFRIPHSDEQQRITDCLGSLDDLIAAQGRKLDALRRHKQGLMQQLFPAPDRHRAMSDAA